MLKKMVSKKKRRFQEDGFDLDLSFITPNIVAMGYPAESIEGIYRNNLKDVKRFFDSRCKEHYKIYNLCAEKEYDPSKFYGRVVRYPFEDHNAPPFELIGECCRDMEAYIKEDPTNVAVIHCKAGKGRTGVIICAYMLHTKMFSDTKTSLDFYAEKRTMNKKGVTIPSQIRYVYYYGAMLSRGVPYAATTLILASIKFIGIPTFAQGTCVPQFTIRKGLDKFLLFGSPPVEGIHRDQKEVVLPLPPLPVCEDIKIEFFHRKSTGKEKMFHLWFNTFFVDDTLTFRLAKPELDKANKDKKHKLFPESFAVELTFTRPSMEEALAAAQLDTPALDKSQSRTSEVPSDSELTDDEEDEGATP